MLTADRGELTCYDPCLQIIMMQVLLPDAWPVPSYAACASTHFPCVVTLVALSLPVRNQQRVLLHGAGTPNGREWLAREESRPTDDVSPPNCMVDSGWGAKGEACRVIQYQPRIQARIETSVRRGHRTSSCINVVGNHGSYAIVSLIRNDLCDVVINTTPSDAVGGGG